MIIMQLKKYTGLILSFCSISILFTSCAKYLEVEPARDQLITEDAFRDDKTADATATGMYTRMINDFSTTMRVASQSADAVAGRRANAINLSIENNALTADNASLTSTWTNLYKIVYAANLILENLETASGVTAAKKQQLLGEARFSRAFAHFMLVNFWDSIPYITTTNVNITSKIRRQAPADVYKYILDDLNEAETLLPANYPTANRARPNKAVATALLAEVHLYLKNWELAEKAATRIIEDNTYKILDDVNNVFLRNSEEVIWQLATVNGFTGDGAAYVPSSGEPVYIYRDDLMNAFEDGDQRKEKWVKTTTVSGVTYYAPFKYKTRALVTVAPVPPAEDLVVFRLAEQYLIRAEARAMQDNLPGAIDDLAMIRDRANPGLGPIDEDIPQTDLLLAIEKERRLELVAEMYHRWFDLKRTGRAATVLGALKPTWVSTAVWYPIPSIEIVRNPNMTQNKGYQ